MPMHFDVGITLIILQTDVVLRAMLLDEVHLKDERLKFRPHYDPFNIGDVAHQAAGLAIVARIGVEITPHTVLQIDRLADVDDCPLGVAIDITARLGGQCGKNALQFLRNFHRRQFYRSRTTTRSQTSCPCPLRFPLRSSPCAPGSTASRSPSQARCCFCSCVICRRAKNGQK